MQPDQEKRSAGGRDAEGPAFAEETQGAEGAPASGERQGFRAYASILKTKEAYAFDLATLLMRLYMPMLTIGMVSMLTLSGYSALFAGSVSSVVAASLFLIAPRVSKLVDERGQSAVVPKAAGIAMGGLVLMLLVVHFGLPQPLCYLCALLMGFSPQPQALARTRWLFLIETGKLGERPPSVRTVFSYEGVIDDIAFMFGPALSIALAASMVPVAGMLFGGCCYALGVAVLMACRSSEPDERWRLAKSEDSGSATAKGERSVLALFPSVRVLFALMLLMGATYGVFDTVTVAFTEGLGQPTAASFCLMVSAVVSIVVGFLFGGMKFKMSPARLLRAAAVLFGVCYGSMFVIEGIPALFWVSVFSALSYAPFLISTSNMCERCVPKHRITEALTWVNAGFSCGSAIGPTLAGLVVDLLGATVGFDAGALFSLAIVPVALLGFRLLPSEKR